MINAIGEATMQQYARASYNAENSGKELAVQKTERIREQRLVLRWREQCLRIGLRCTYPLWRCEKRWEKQSGVFRVYRQMLSAASDLPQRSERALASALTN